MKRRVYVDTSVLGGCEDGEFREHSRKLMQAIARGDCTLVLSELTLRELAAAPDAVRRTLQDIPEDAIETLPVSEEADDLASSYVNDGAVGESMYVDALHIAIATVGRVDVLVSWNFRHIVNLQRIRAYNAVNLREGYPLLEIRSPREVLGDE